MGDFKRWSDDAIVGFGDGATVDQLVAAERGVNELQRHLEAELEERRVRPQDDLLTSLLEARIDDDDPEVTDTRPLATAEVLGVVQQLIVGGNETTTKALTELMRHLADHPEHWAAVQQDPSTIPTIIEESLRLSSPVQGFPRTATRDVELGGVAIAKGQRLVVTYASANRDEALFADPEAFDPRPGRPHRPRGLRQGPALLPRGRPGPARAAGGPGGAVPTAGLLHPHPRQRLPLQRELPPPRPARAPPRHHPNRDSRP